MTCVGAHLSHRLQLQSIEFDMLARFILVSFCLISHGSSGLLESPTREEGMGRELPAGTSDIKQSLRALGPSVVQPSKVKPSETTPQPLIDRLRSYFTSPFAKSPLKSVDQPASGSRMNDFTAQKSSETKEFWMKNEDKVILFYQHLKELSALDSQLQGQRDSLFEDHTKHPDVFTKWSIDAIEGLRQLNDRLIILSQVKLLELGGIDLPTFKLNLMKLVFSKDNHKSMMYPDVDRLPGDLVQDISNRIWKNLGESIVLDLKKLIIDSHLFFLNANCYDADYRVLLWWKYALTILDLLFTIEFVEHDTIREFFGNLNIVEKFLRYLILRQCDTGILFSIMRGSLEFPKQWYWPLWHECLKALRTKEQNLLRGHLLLQARSFRIFSLATSELRNVPKWKDFFIDSPFDPSQYLVQLISGGNSLTTQAQDVINFDIERMIKLVTVSYEDLESLTPLSKWHMLCWLHDVLAYFDEHLFPGIIKKTLAEHPEAKSYEMQREIWKLNSQLDDSNWNAGQYFKYVQLESPLDWSTSSLYKSTFDAYLNQSIQILSQFKKELERLREQLQNQPNQLTYIQSLSVTEASFVRNVEKLRQMSAKFQF